MIIVQTARRDIRADIAHGVTRQTCALSLIMLAFLPSRRASGDRMITLKINGEQHSLDIEAEMPLLWAIRNEIGLTGTKYGCGIAQCGACTVLMDGKAVRSCSLPVSSAQGHAITTIEGLAEGGML